MASIKANKNKDGKIISYRFRACTGRDETGKQLFATKTVDAPEDLTPVKALKQMQTEADAWEKGIAAGTVPIKKTSFKHFVDNTWMPVYVKDGSHKPTTISYYENIAIRLLEHFGDMDIAKIKPLDIQKYLNTLRTSEKQKNGKPLSSYTIIHYTTVLKILFNFALKHDLIQQNPMLKVSVPKQEYKSVKFLTPEQSQKFITTLEEAPLKYKLLMNLLINTGLRRGESVALQWSDVDYDSLTISISKSATLAHGEGVIINTPKTKNSIRKLPISQSLCSLFRKWQAEQAAKYGEKTLLLPSAYIFNDELNVYKCMYPSTPTHWLYDFMKAHNLPQITSHILRHTCASLMLLSGTPVKVVQDTLGHADASITLKFYAGTTPESLRNATDNLSDFLNMKKAAF